MNRYLFHFGNSDEGAIGGVCSVYAKTKEQALRMLKAYYEQWSNEGDPYVDRNGIGQPYREGVDYANVWINPDYIKLTDGWCEEEEV